MKKSLLELTSPSANSDVEMSSVELDLQVDDALDAIINADIMDADTDSELSENNDDYQLLAHEPLSHVAFEIDAEAPVLAEPDDEQEQEPLQLSPSRFSFLKNDHFLFLKILSTAFYGLLTHDIFMQACYPSKRYGNTWANVFGGLPLAHPAAFGHAKTNQQTWTNHFGTDNVANYPLYWLPTAFAVATPLLDTSIKLGITLAKRFQRDAEAEVAAAPAQHTFTRFVLKPFAAQAMIYSYLRFVSILAQKIQETKIHNANKATCENTNRVYSYLDEFADFACTVLGDERDNTIDSRDLYDPQDYLNALLAAPRAPEWISEQLDKLAKFSGYRVIDMSRQDWTNWDDKLFEEIFIKLTSLKANLTLLDMSDELDQSSYLTARKVKALVSFMQSTPIHTFKMEKQLLDSHLGNVFLQGLKNQRYEIFSLKSTNVGSLSSSALSQINISALDVADTQENDEGIASIVSNPNPIYEINLNHNPLRDTALKTLASTKNKNEIETLHLSGLIDLSPSGLNELSRLGNLKNVDISNNDLDGSELAVFNQANFPQLRALNISGNNLEDTSAAATFFENVSIELQTLDLSYTKITEESVSYVTNYLRSANVETFRWSGNYLSVTAFQELMQGVFDSRISRLILSNCALSADHINVIHHFLSRSGSSLIAINLDDNAINDDMGYRLIDVFRHTSIRELSIENNLLSNIFGYTLRRMIPQSNLSHVNINSNPLQGDSVAAIIQAGQLTALSADNIFLSDADVITIAENIIDSPYSLSYLTNTELSIDERRALHQATPRYPLAMLSLVNSGMSQLGRDLLYRVLPATNIANSHLKLDDFHAQHAKQQPSSLFVSRQLTANLSTLNVDQDIARDNQPNATLLQSVQTVSALVFLAWLLHLCTNRWRHQAGFYSRATNSRPELHLNAQLTNPTPIRNNQV